VLTLTVPGLLADGAQAFASLRSARALARYADAPALDREGLGAALCAALALPHATPLAPLCALGAGLSIDDRYVIAATPVMLVADRDRLVLAGRVADLAVGETETLLARLNAHFAADGVTFAAPRPSAWFALSERSFDLSTSSVDLALGHPIAEFLPRGPDKSTWQRWQVEIQMLFHEHAINDARTVRSALVVSGVWLSGAGRLSDVATPPLTRVFAASGEHGDLARGLARKAGLSADARPAALSAILDRMQRDSHTLVAMDATVDQTALAELDARWIAPAADALASGALDALQLIGDGHGAAVTWRATRPSFLRRAFERFSHRRLIIPRIDE
jgi:hypothetical protein